MERDDAERDVDAVWRSVCKLVETAKLCPSAVRENEVLLNEAADMLNELIAKNEDRRAA